MKICFEDRSGVGMGKRRLQVCSSVILGQRQLVVFRGVVLESSPRAVPNDHLLAATEFALKPEQRDLSGLFDH